MDQDLGAQAVDAAILAKSRHMRIEGVSPFRQQIGQGRPVAIRPRAVQSGIECLGVTEIRVNQTGKHHARRDRQVEAARCRAHQLSQFLGDRAKIWAGRGRDFRRDRVAEGLKPALHTAVGAMAIRQPGVMAQDGIADHFRNWSQTGRRPGM
nr:hypothetical protein [Paracoccus denitrificans]